MWGIREDLRGGKKKRRGGKKKQNCLTVLSFFFFFWAGETHAERNPRLFYFIMPFSVLMTVMLMTPGSSEHFPVHPWDQCSYAVLY